MLYESLLLFGVVYGSGWLFDTLTESRHALTLRHTRQAWLFLVIGAYFIFFWCRSGQTLAMKTWRFRLAASDGSSVPFRNALLRYLLAWMWCMPALAVNFALGLKQWSSISVILIGALVWLAATFRDPQRQFLHDRLAGTRLLDIRENKPALA